MSRSKTVNNAIFAGRWYPEEEAALTCDLEGYLARAEGRPGKVRGAVLPHAGLSYSGYGMADAFASLRDAWERGADTPPRRVLLLSPSHYHPLPADTLTVESFASHQTPLGSIRGDPEFWGSGEGLRPGNREVEEEHGTELFFPFIRHILPEETTLSLGLVAPLSSLETTERLASLILERLERRDELDSTLILVSSDFTHYGTRFDYAPFGSAATEDDLPRLEAAVESEDRQVAQMAAASDSEALLRRYGSPITVCGRYPILLGASLFPRLGATGELVRYYNSNSFGPRRGEFVCYCSIVFLKDSS
ncbi:MAG: AmmeMemoRadiSam system protein B [Spirochaetaceae bacterium]